jgi:hypothetical protein
MRKLKLDLDDIEVQSFDTLQLHEELQGTVHGEQLTARTGCAGGATCVASCCHTDKVDI